MTADERRASEIAAEVELTLGEQSRRVELQVAYARATAFIGVALTVWAFSFLGGEAAPPRALLVVSLGALLAVGLVVALRQGLYSPRIALVTPFFEAGYSLAMFTVLLDRFGAEGLARRGITLTMALGCALIVVLGGLRLQRSTIIASTVAVVPLFAYQVLQAGTRQTLVTATSLLLAIAAISYFTGEMVRRAIAAEVSRQFLTRFLPRQVLAGAHGDPLALLTRPRSCEATVLVSDLRGFTALSENLPPEELLTLLNELQGAFAEVVQGLGGTVDKFMGDGMLAAFGALEPMPDHAARGVRAARGILDATTRINAVWAAAGRPTVKVGIGLHTGPVVTGCLGSGSRLEFTLLGDTVNTASRLEALTKEHGVPVVVSAETARQAAPHLEGTAPLRPLGEVTLRGRREPLAVLALEA